MPTTRHPVPLIALLLALSLGIISFLSLGKLQMAGKTADELRQSTRVAAQLTHHLEAQTIAYELALNEYYSTVIDQTRYLEKASSLRQSINADLSRLSGMPVREYAVAGGELQKLIGEIDKFRGLLDQAMDERKKDWDGAREALFKINILSTRAIEVASGAANAARERGDVLEGMLAEQHASTQMLLYIAIAISGLFAIGAGIQLRASRQ